MKKKFTKGELNRVRERLWVIAKERTMRKIFGYCRVSTSDQSHNLQRDSLIGAGVTDLFEETASGAPNAPYRTAALRRFLRPAGMPRI